MVLTVNILHAMGIKPKPEDQTIFLHTRSVTHISHVLVSEYHTQKDYYYQMNTDVYGNFTTGKTFDIHDDKKLIKIVTIKYFNHEIISETTEFFTKQNKQS